MGNSKRLLSLTRQLSVSWRHGGRISRMPRLHRACPGGATTDRLGSEARLDRLHRACPGGATTDRLHRACPGGATTDRLSGNAQAARGLAEQMPAGHSRDVLRENRFHGNHSRVKASSRFKMARQMFVHAACSAGSRAPNQRQATCSPPPYSRGRRPAVRRATASRSFLRPRRAYAPARGGRRTPTAHPSWSMISALARPGHALTQSRSDRSAS